MKIFTLTTEHVRAARMFLRWNQTDLAQHSGISVPTIARLEAKPGPLGGLPSTVAAIRRALEHEGIVFFNGDAPGVRLYRTPYRTRVRSRKSTPVKAIRKARALRRKGTEMTQPFGALGGEAGATAAHRSLPAGLTPFRPHSH